MSAFPLQRDIEYPESDGQPMAETDLHRDEMIELILALTRRYQDVPDVYVSGNLFLYYVQGDPRAVVAPDVFLVRGVPKRKRRIYKLWEEGRVPSLVIELTSDNTQDEDIDRKKSLYQRLGVEEYFLHDPY
jgi:Uma2 family endonuclease